MRKLTARKPITRITAGVWALPAIMKIRPLLSAAIILMRKMQIPSPRHWRMLMIMPLYCAKRTLSSDTLAYVQMAVTAMELAAESSGPAVELQWVLDDIMAFRGSCEENIEEEINRNIIKSGASLERVDIFLRLGYPQEQCLKEVRHLASRLKKAQLAVNENNMQFLLNSLAGSPENLPPAPVLTAAAEGLLVNI